MVTFSHKSVLLDECLQALAPKDGVCIADVTAGGGGHSAEILARLGDSGRLLCIDRDDVAVEHVRARFLDRSNQVTVARGPFSALADVMAEHGVSHLNGVLADLGVSSPQLDVAERGFSLREVGPLDMRMDRSRGPTALELVDESDEGQLADLIYKYGEERRSRPIARSIKRALADNKLTTTGDLRAAVVRVTGPKRGRIDPSTRTFQALRIAVNDELGELRNLLHSLPHLLADDGVAAIISFHSLEDRMVKHTFRDEARLQPLSRKPVIAGEVEQSENPRARSAKLRVARRICRSEEGAS